MLNAVVVLGVLEGDGLPTAKFRHDRSYVLTVIHEFKVDLIYNARVRLLRR